MASEVDKPLVDSVANKGSRLEISVVDLNNTLKCQNNILFLFVNAAIIVKFVMRSRQNNVNNRQYLRMARDLRRYMNNCYLVR